MRPPSRSGTRRAHPRSRGENGSTLGRASATRGSSPLTRGKLQPGEQTGSYKGLIPAHAGKTSPLFGRYSECEAHPRSRGENFTAEVITALGGGSSPLTRGKPRPVLSSLKQSGLIPAHAGKTLSRRSKPPPPSAHPRSRGENASIDAKAAELGGSSPLTRGKPRRRRPVHGRCRLIPAHAGKTPRPAARPCRLRAHPRSRGENGVECGELTVEGGSSPLTRGKHSDAQMRVDLEGLIPAHAGKTRRGPSV